MQLRNCVMLFVYTQGAGRAFSAGGDLKMFYDGRTSSNHFLLKLYCLQDCIFTLSLLMHHASVFAFVRGFVS